jgi:hypothetical protein
MAQVVNLTCTTVYPNGPIRVIPLGIPDRRNGAYAPDVMLAPFLERLAKGINGVVPAGFEQQPEDMEWAFWPLDTFDESHSGSPWPLSYDWKPPREERELRDGAIRVLDAVQDQICEGLTEPWPNEGIAPVPAVRGKVANHQLELWFEVDGEPVLVLPPITLTG